VRVLAQIALLALLLVPRAERDGHDFSPPQGLYTAAVHTFDLNRSGTAVDDAVTGLRHPASHMNDALLAGTDQHRDLTGGWYNAADYGKWTMMTAITVSYMLNLYDSQERASQLGSWKQQPIDPKLLDNARWGLAWMLKMQDSDGGVRHKVDGATQASLAAAWGKPPQNDPNVRIAAPAATGSTADFAAVMYQAAQFFAFRDGSAARQFRGAADRAWLWIGRHPDVPAHDPFYADHDLAGDWLWAKSEHALTYGLDSPDVVDEIKGRAQREVSSDDPSLLGIYQLASSQKSAPQLRSVARASLLQQAQATAAVAEGRAFHVALGERDYSWGSAERVLQWAAFFLMADALQPNSLLRQAAVDQLAWMLGNNAAHHSFIAGFGTNPVLHPYHWAYKDYVIAMPGWAVLGPNGYPDGVDPALRALQERGTAPAQCYVDLCSREGSWASNEGQITEEAALVFVTGMLRLSRPIGSA
jgi:endoglucanase